MCASGVRKCGETSRVGGTQGSMHPVWMQTHSMVLAVLVSLEGQSTLDSRLLQLSFLQSYRELTLDHLEPARISHRQTQAGMQFQTTLRFHLGAALGSQLSGDTITHTMMLKMDGTEHAVEKSRCSSFAHVTTFRRTGACLKLAGRENCYPMVGWNNPVFLFVYR